MIDPTVKVPNWSEFQHYKDRSPPWIKLHRQLLNNRQWHSLSAPACKLLVELWLIAAETVDGTIAEGTDDLAWRVRRDPGELASLLIELEAHEFLDLSVHDARIVIAGCMRDAGPEVREKLQENPNGRDIEKTPGGGFPQRGEHTTSSLALEAHTVLGMGLWGNEFSKKFADTKGIISRHWARTSYDSVYAAIHGLRKLVDAGAVEWLADCKGKPLRGLEVLVDSRTILQGPDGGQMRSLFTAAVDAYYADDGGTRRRATAGPQKLNVEIPGHPA